MDVDPTRNAVAFRVRGDDDVRTVIAAAPTRDANCVQQAWESARRNHQIEAGEVSELYSLWQPSEHDARFIAQTFPGAEFGYSFARPGPHPWTDELHHAGPSTAKGARAAELAERIRQIEAEEDSELLPVLCGHSSARGEAMLGYAVHQPLVPEKVYIMLALTGPTPRGTVGMSWLTRHSHRRLGEPPFASLLELAAQNLKRGLRVVGHRFDYGDGLLVLHRESSLASSAVALPDFHEQISSILHADRLIVGIPGPDELLVADMDSRCAEEVRTRTLASEDAQGFLGPSLLLVEPSKIQLLADRPV